MLSLMTGFLVPLAAIYVWGLSAAPAWMRQDAASQRIFFLVTVAIPLASAWASAELVNLLTPRRLLHRHFRRRRFARFSVGLLAGTASAAIAAALLPVADRFVADGLITGIPAALALAAATAFLSRVRPGRCIQCGYDLRDGPGPGHAGAGICPECGTPVLAGAAARTPGAKRGIAPAVLEPAAPLAAG